MLKNVVYNEICTCILKYIVKNYVIAEICCILVASPVGL